MAASDKAILDGERIMPTDDLRAWARWFKDVNHRRVALTVLPDGRQVSTVFLGINHGFRDCPQWFETAVLLSDGDTAGPGFWGEERRYATYAEAEAGHAEVVRRLSEEASGDGE